VKWDGENVDHSIFVFYKAGYFQVTVTQVTAEVGSAGSLSKIQELIIVLCIKASSGNDFYTSVSFAVELIFCDICYLYYSLCKVSGVM